MCEAELDGGDRCFVLVQPVKGLCNRLRAIIAAAMFAEDIGYELVVYWREHPCCNCPWERLARPAHGLTLLSDELLERDLSIQSGHELLGLWELVGCAQKAGGDLSQRALDEFKATHHEYFARGLAHFVDLASAQWKGIRRQRLRESGRCGDLPDFLRMRCICFRAFDGFYPPDVDERNAAVADRSRVLNQLLIPQPAISKRVWALPPGTVCVHIRRTDHCTSILHSPEEFFVKEMDMRCMPGWEVARNVPFGQFFLATDDPEVEMRLRNRYGEKLVTYTKRALDRSLPEAIEDALVDILLLAQGTEILGSYKSSFGSIASLFRQVSLTVIYREASGSMHNRGSQDFIPYKEFDVNAGDPSVPTTSTAGSMTGGAEHDRRRLVEDVECWVAERHNGWATGTHTESVQTPSGETDSQEAAARAVSWRAESMMSHCSRTSGGWPPPPGRRRAARRALLDTPIVSAGVVIPSSEAPLVPLEGRRSSAVGEPMVRK